MIKNFFFIKNTNAKTKTLERIWITFYKVSLLSFCGLLLIAIASSALFLKEYIRGSFYVTPAFLKEILMLPQTSGIRYVSTLILIIVMACLFFFILLNFFFLLKKKSFDEVFNIRFRVMVAFLISIGIFFLSFGGNEIPESQNFVQAVVCFLDERNAFQVEILKVIRIYIFRVYRVENIPLIVSAVFLPGLGLMRSVSAELFSTGFFLSWFKQIKTPIISSTSISEHNIPVRRASSSPRIEVATKRFISLFYKRTKETGLGMLEILKQAAKSESDFLYTRLDVVQKHLQKSPQETYNIKRLRA